MILKREIKMYQNHEILREHSLKATPQRLAIIELMQKHGHISIDNLYLYIKEKFHSLSLATLYKNINIMIGVDLVKEVKIPNNKSKYELTKKPHSHLLCTKCNKISDIFIDLKNIIKECEKNSHYNISETTLLLRGLCPKCN